MPRPLHTADSPLFELRSSPIQGTGAFALSDIPKGTRIIEYVGEKISNREADRRYDDDKMPRHHTFLFTLNDRYVVDAAVGGNESRFINHSCAPNCEAVIERGRIYIDALKDIPAGTELSYDYAYERSDDHDQNDEALYFCRCGTPECRGTILAPPPKKRKRSAARKKSKSKRTRTAGKRTKGGPSKSRKTKRTKTSGPRTGRTGSRRGSTGSRRTSGGGSR